MNYTILTTPDILRVQLSTIQALSHKERFVIILMKLSDKANVCLFHYRIPKKISLAVKTNAKVVDIKCVAAASTVVSQTRVACTVALCSVRQLCNTNPLLMKLLFLSTVISYTHCSP